MLGQEMKRIHQPDLFHQGAIDEIHGYSLFSESRGFSLPQCAFAKDVPDGLVQFARAEHRRSRCAMPRPRRNDIRESFCRRQLVSHRGVSFQLANLLGKASWRLAPRVSSHLRSPFWSV